jgi:hypothetical protein
LVLTSTVRCQIVSGFRTGDESSPIAGSASSDAAHLFVTIHPSTPISPKRPWAAQAEAVLILMQAPPGPPDLREER